MSSSSSVPVPPASRTARTVAIPATTLTATTTTTAATITAAATAVTTTATTVTTPTITLELMDAKESQVDSIIPINASAETSLDTNQNTFVSSKISGDAYPISTPGQVAQQPRSCPEDMALIQESLGSLNFGTSYATSGGELPPRNGPSDLYKSAEMGPVGTQGKTTDYPSPQSTVPSQSESSHPIRLVPRNSARSSEASDGTDSLPVIVTSSQSRSPEPFAEHLKPVVPMLIDEPDERLLSALETRDRLFVIGLEQDVTNFIQENICEVFDLPPINAYQRLLAHKMAEYYRLTHVADTTGASVRFFRGQHARIPPVRLGDKPNAVLQQNSAINGSTPPMKIMRRTRSDKGPDTPPEHRNSNTPKKPSSETSSGEGSARTNSREEREEAYRAARERIFKDFSPETPPPTKSNEKQRRQEQPDDFSGRSQFFPVLSPTPPAISSHYYPHHENPVLQFQNNSHMPVAQRFNPNTPSFNPALPNFNPPNDNFTPRPYMPAVSNRQFQTPNDMFNVQSPVGIGHIRYPQQQSQPQQNHPQPHHQQCNGFYDQSGHFNLSGHLSQQHNQMISPSSNPPRVIPQQPPHFSSHHSLPPVPASGNRHPYNAPSNYAVNNNVIQPRFPQHGFVWNPTTAGGVPMSVTRSQPSMQNFDRNGPPFGVLPYQGQQQHWGSGGTAFGRGGYGADGGMHGPVGGM